MGGAADRSGIGQEQYGEEVQFVDVEAGWIGGCSSREGAYAGMCQEFPSGCCYASKISIISVILSVCIFDAAVA